MRIPPAEPLEPDPIAYYRAYLDRAREAEPFDPTRAALATGDERGHPSLRFVLVKHASAEGFVFFTDYRSRKARDLDANPHAALAWHWSTIGVQVRAEGAVTRSTPEESQAYFTSRPRGSQLGAWASHQSSPIATRVELEASLADVRARFGDGPIPCPEHWGGYRLAPSRMELWINGDDRLHDRFAFERDGESWLVRRLAP